MTSEKPPIFVGATQVAPEFPWRDLGRTSGNGGFRAGPQGPWGRQKSSQGKGDFLAGRVSLITPKSAGGSAATRDFSSSSTTVNSVSLAGFPCLAASHVIPIAKGLWKKSIAVESARIPGARCVVEVSAGKRDWTGGS